MKLEFNLPNFDGFYNSGFGDFEISDDIESYGDVTEEEHDNINWDKTHENIAVKYLDKFNEQNAELLSMFGLKPFIFSKVDSPKTYNFRTDYLVCSTKFNFNKVLKLFRTYINENLTSFKELVKDRHSSYDGFHSFYSNDVNTWLNDYLTKDKFDNIIFETLLMFVLDNHLSSEYDHEQIYYHTIENQMELIEY